MTILGMPMIAKGDNDVVLDPDLVCKAGDKAENTLIAVIKVKLWWSFDIFQDPSAQYNMEIKSEGTDSKLVRGIQQIYGYMSCNHLRYGILTIYNGTYFLKRVEESTFLISEPKTLNQIILSIGFLFAQNHARKVCIHRQKER